MAALGEFENSHAVREVGDSCPVGGVPGWFFPWNVYVKVLMWAAGAMRVVIACVLLIIRLVGGGRPVSPRNLGVPIDIISVFIPVLRGFIGLISGLGGTVKWVG